MQFVSKNEIKIGRELSDLDLFTLDFVEVLKKYAKYAIVSGYVSILLGRARASEDVDIIVPKIDFFIFKKLYDNLIKKSFYCINTSKCEEAFDYLNGNIPVRFAKKESVIPNIELKFAKNKADSISLSNTIKVKLNKNELTTSNLEMQIAFKENVLKSPKDIEDARHIRNIAKGHLDYGLIKKYEGMLDGI